MNRGETMLAVVRNMQKLNSEIAALLKTAERLLSDRGFKNNLGSSVTKDCSYSIDLPSYWTPPHMYRVFENKKDKDDVIILNVILDDPENPEKIHEPIICCVRFKYKRQQAKKFLGIWDAWDLWFIEPAKKLNQLYNKDDLGINSEEFILYSGWDKEEIASMNVVRFIAVPLANITDSKALHVDLFERIF